MLFELNDRVCRVVPLEPKNASVPRELHILLVPSPVYSEYHGVELVPKLYGYTLELA